MVRPRTVVLAALLVVALLAAFLLWRSPNHVRAQGPEPVCDVSCGPDPGGSGYEGTFAARTSLPNARGLSSSIVPKQISLPGGHEPDRGPGRGPKPVVLLGSESYNYAVPVLSLPGRNGLDLNLTLHYSSRIWTIDSANNTVTFNADRDFPSYGFRLGFGFLEYDAISNTFVLTEADGTKRGMSISEFGGYDSDDSSYINYNPSTKVLRYKNGTQVLYENFPDDAFSATHLRPKKITDTNGYCISITYLTGTGRNQHINTITDTMVGFGLRARCRGVRAQDPGVERGGRLHAGVPGAGGGHQLRRAAGDAGAGRDRGRARGAGSDPLRQRAGADQPSLPGLVRGAGIELRHIQPGKPVQKARVESFHGRLREECLRVSWFENLFAARRKIAAWRKEYNEERPHSSLGYRTPKEFATWMGAAADGSSPSSAAKTTATATANDVI